MAWLLPIWYDKNSAATEFARGGPEAGDTRGCPVATAGTKPAPLHPRGWRVLDRLPTMTPGV